MKNLVILIIVLLIFSCTNRKGIKNDSESGKFFDINFEQALANKQELTLSQTASDVEYIKLETGDDYMVRPVVRYFFTDISWTVRVNFPLHLVQTPCRGIRR